MTSTSQMIQAVNLLQRVKDIFANNKDVDPKIIADNLIRVDNEITDFFDNNPREVFNALYCRMGGPRLG